MIKVEDLVKEDWKETNVEDYVSGKGFEVSHYERAKYDLAVFMEDDYEVNNDGVCILRKKNKFIPDYDGPIAVPYNMMEYVNLRDYECLGLSKDLKTLGKNGKKVVGCIVINKIGE